MSYIHRLIVFFFLSVLSFNSFSYVSKGYIYSTQPYNSPSSGYIFYNLGDACAYLIGKPVANSGYVVSSVAVSNTRNSCYFGFYSNSTGGKVAYVTSSSEVSYAPNPNCPSNSSPSGSQCICNEGYEEKNGNSCELPKPPDPCEGLEAYCAAKQNNNFDWQVKGKSKSRQWTCQSAQSWVSGIGDGSTGYVDDFPGCSRGCMGRSSGFDTSIQDDAGNWFTLGQGKYVGSTCEPSVIADLNGGEGDDDNPPEIDKNSDKTCPNGFKGTVNGVSVCLPPKASSGVTELETKDNGDGTKTESKTQVQCENGKCSITKNTTTTNNETNNVVNSSSVTTTVDQADYCSKNPTAGVCKDETGKGGAGEGKVGDFSGSCEAGFSCGGDAIQCAIAKIQHEDSCRLFSPAPKEIIPDGTEKDSAEDLKNNATVINVQTDLDYSGLGWNRSCPADEDYDLGFVNAKMTIPYSKLCAVLSPMSDIALAITALALLTWLVAGKKEA